MFRISNKFFAEIVRSFAKYELLAEEMTINKVNDIKIFQNHKNMKNAIIVLFACLLVMSCGNGGRKQTREEADASVVYVYYFHGKQRCKTCMAVEGLTKETVAENFNGNDRVKYSEVKTGEVENDALIEKYNVTWNALIIAKGEEYVDITNEAFATAVNHPEKLRQLIKQTVNSMSE